MNIRASLRGGLITGIINLFIVLLGLTILVGNIVMEWFDLSSPNLGGWIVLLIVALWGGMQAVQRVQGPSWGSAILLGLLAGALNGILLAVFAWVLGSLVAAEVNVRTWLAQLSPESSQMLTFGQSPLIGAAILFAALTVAGLLGGLLAQVSAQRERKEERLGLGTRVRERFLAVPAVQRFAEYKYARYVLYGAGLLVLFILPLLVNQYQNYILGTVGIYVMLGLGLNIVVGLAGLLDLGYVAFYAIGAYTVAMLTAPEPHGILMNFWVVLPIGIIFASISGVLLGIPVLRMRGDYLAIVTLGFGEIIRILSKSDALTSFTGGPRGIRAIAGPGTGLSNEFYYMIVLGILLVVFLTYRLQHSRVGRAWMAMREDEDVAEAMGIYTLRYKLLAFAIGAAFAGLGGVIFAARNKFTGPEDFTLLVSINVLCLVIIGGMGSIPGVVMGAIVLKGVPEMLRELDDYRMLVFGALLVVMMILRPEGIWPSSRRRMELKPEEDLLPVELQGVES